MSEKLRRLFSNPCRDLRFWIITRNGEHILLYNPTLEKIWKCYSGLNEEENMLKGNI